MRSPFPLLRLRMRCPGPSRRPLVMEALCGTVASRDSGPESAGLARAADVDESGKLFARPCAFRQTKFVYIHFGLDEERGVPRDEIPELRICGSMFKAGARRSGLEHRTADAQRS